MRWAISIDPRPEHDGPLRLAAWLAQRKSTADDRLVGVHVLPRLSELAGLWDGDAISALLTKVEANCRRNIAETTDLEIALEVDEADDVPLGLAEAARQHDSHCLVVGRHARLQDDRLIRLGRIARRLLRNLPAPLAVTPPHWQVPDEPGPVIVATDLLAHSEPAGVFARRLAAEYELPLAVAHVAHVFKWIGSSLPAGAFDAHAAQAVDAGRLATETWCKTQGLDAPILVAAGDPTSALAQLAVRERASLIVCGARRLSPIERTFHASVGADLAASMPCPVFVVPEP